VVATAPTPAAEDVVVHVEHVMGTAVSFHVRPGPLTHAQARAAVARACAVLHEDDATFSLWRAGTPSQLLRRGELSIWDAPEAVREVFARCLVARRASGGWFDPWRLPGGYDPTGLVKGWSAMRCLAELRAAGVAAAMVNAGGDVALLGARRPGEPWRIGVRDPHHADRVLFAVAGAGAVATSGTYERGEHLLDPFSGLPGTAAASATVTGPELDLADALATALACAGPAALPLVDGLAGYEACLVLPDRSCYATEAFPFAPGACVAQSRRRRWLAR
jgi:thiamine biosynthesis lipoprotein